MLSTSLALLLPWFVLNSNIKDLSNLRDTWLLTDFNASYNLLQSFSNYFIAKYQKKQGPRVEGGGEGVIL